MFDVVIIGGGAAGLFLASNLPTDNALLLDHKDAVGKKLLITGGGMCNLTNIQPPEEFLSHYGNRSQRNFLLPSLHAFPPSALMEWFKRRGVPLLIREDGKVFPASLDAHQIRDVLLRESKATIQYNTNISAITQDDNGFTITTNKGILQSKRIVLSTGGMSYPRTGSDGSGYALAKSLGHSIIPPKQALAAIAIEEYRWKHLAGNAVRSVSAKFYHSGEKKPFRVGTGDILFTHDGLSGPLVLTASRELMQGDTITFSLLPMEHKATVQQYIFSLLGEHPKKQITTILKEIGLVSSLAQQVVKECSLALSSTPANLSKQQRQSLINAVTETSVTVKQVKGFNAAMVTAGGIDLKEVDRKCMESKLITHLYFCGEILDVDGPSGGYNLQAAFSTAYCIAEHIVH